MPYSSTSDLPAQAKNLSPKQKRAFLQAFNSAHRDGKSEKSAFRIAWAAAKKSDEEETSKHLEGKHDQKDHGNRIRQSLGEISMRKRRQRIKEVQGEDFAETTEKVVSWLHERSEDQVEHLFAVDKRSGKVMDYNIGVERSSGMSRRGLHRALLQSAKGGFEGNHALFHNHPTVQEGHASMGAAPSPADMAFALGNGVDMHIVDSEEHVVVRPEEKSKAKADFVREHADSLGNIPLLMGLMDAEKVGDEATYVLAREHGHDLWKSFADQLQIQYKVKSLKKEKASKHLVGEHDQDKHGREQHTGIIRATEEPRGPIESPDEFASNLATSLAVLAAAAASYRFGIQGVRYAAPKIIPHHRASTFKEASDTFQRNSLGKEMALDNVLDTKASYSGQHGVIRRADLDALQGANRTETLANIESKIRGTQREMGFVVDKRGKIAQGMYGDGTSAPLPAPMKMARSDRNQYTFTHNHPVEVPLSSADVNVQEVFALGEMRAVLPSGSVSKMTYNATGAKSIPGQVRGSFQTTSMVMDDSKYLQMMAQRHQTYDPTKLMSNEKVRLPYFRRAEEGYRNMADKNPGTWSYELLENVVKHRVLSPEVSPSVQTMYRLGNLPAHYAKRVKG